MQVDRDNYSPGAWALVAGRQRRRVNMDYGGTQDFFVDIAVSAAGMGRGGGIKTAI